MNAAQARKGILTTVGFLLTVSIGILVPTSVPIMAFAQGESNGLGPFGPFLTPAGLTALAIVWLGVVGGGIWAGVRHPDRAFFRGSFLGAVIVAGCTAILAIAALVSNSDDAA